MNTLNFLQYFGRKTAISKLFNPIMIKSGPNIHKIGGINKLKGVQ